MVVAAVVLELVVVVMLVLLVEYWYLGTYRGYLRNLVISSKQHPDS